MFTNHTFRRLPVALALAGAVCAFTVPQALAGGNSKFGAGNSKYGTPDGWYGWALAQTNADQQASTIDGRSPDTKDAATSAQEAMTLSPVERIILQENARRNLDSRSVVPARRSKPGPLDGRSPDTRDAALTASLAKANPKTVTYLLWHGYTPNQIATMLAGMSQASTPQQLPATPVDGRSPDTIDAAVQTHAPVVTIVRSPGFEWGDFGIGVAAACGLMLLLGLSIRLLTARQNRKQPSPVATA
jgi:hypothetical protein